jgi:hypothetical protein
LCADDGGARDEVGSARREEHGQLRTEQERDDGRGPVRALLEQTHECCDMWSCDR